jgi:hypothetical protein
MKLLSLFKTPLIEFLCSEEDFGNIPEPIPASKLMPQWFKDIKPAATDKGNRDQYGGVAMSAKKCSPLLDALSLGYIIPLWGDINIRTSAEGETNQFIELGGNWFGMVASFHSPSQLGGNTNKLTKGMPAVKWINRIVIKTAPGYSTLFIPPIGHIEPRFTCLPGLVDTDRYPKEVNFPALWHAMGHDAIVAAGTPLVTCIPIRRSDMGRDARLRAMTKLEAKTIGDIGRRQASRRHVYTDELREPRK